MAIVRWDPLGEAMRMQREMDRIFARLGQAEARGDGVAWMPKVDVKRTGDDIAIRAELPGIKPEDVDIELTDNVLTIKGQRKADRGRGLAHPREQFRQLRAVAVHSRGRGSLGHHGELRRRHP